MLAKELRQKYIDYYLNHNHNQTDVSTIVAPQDAGVLFTTAGMQPLIPYFKGKKHPNGKRLVNVQPCVRTVDISEVGDDYHLTVFEMLGNWSLGDYYKRDAITMSFEFLTKEVGIPLSKLAVTIHEGNQNVPLDLESLEVWLDLGLKRNQIFMYGDSENWWGPVNETGPCGPDSEMFYVNDVPNCSDHCGPACSCGKYIELGNNVFISYHKNETGELDDLKQQNVDVGIGLERVHVLKNNLTNVYESDIFAPIIDCIQTITGERYNKENQRLFRIISDHIRASIFIMNDPQQVVPSNTEHGYVLRRLIRRIIRSMYQLGYHQDPFGKLVEVVYDTYLDSHPEWIDSKSRVLNIFEGEFASFNKTLKKGSKSASKIFNSLNPNEVLCGEDAFSLYETYGFPIEMIVDMAEENDVDVDVEGFYNAFKLHQEKSKSQTKGQMKSGLENVSVQSIKLHTATHLLHSSLRRVLGEQVEQKGSHINKERLRFDFSFERKLTQEEIMDVEQLVNHAISLAVPVTSLNMSVKEAIDQGAIGLFTNVYDEIVSVYKIGDISNEICRGPHVNNISELGTFKIVSEKSSAAGIRRIKAILK